LALPFWPAGRHQLDAFVRRYIHENLPYRFVLFPDGSAAYALEAAIKSGNFGTWPSVSQSCSGVKRRLFRFQIISCAKNIFIVF
jgi:hypothetical protein